MGEKNIKKMTTLTNYTKGEGRQIRILVLKSENVDTILCQVRYIFRQKSGLKSVLEYPVPLDCPLTEWLNDC